MKYSIIRFYFYLLVIFLTKQSMVRGECTCEKDDQPQDGKSITLKYKLASIGAILGTSAIGVSLPLLGNRVPVLKPENDIFFMIKAFAAGVILATGFIHILPEAFEGLTSPCIGETPWQKFPFASFIAMVAAIGSLMVDTLATGHYRRVHYEESGNKNKNQNNININNKVVDEERNDEHANHVHVHSHATHGHAHGHGGGSIVGNNGDFGEQSSKLDLIRHRVTAQVLELGVLVHSVIIGISLGTSQSLDTIKPLMVALCFHQFFEGMGLGGCILQAKFKSQATLTMAIFFSLTTPIGIAIGIAITGVYDENNARSLIIQGTFEAAAAGILIYMALVDLLAADFMNPRMQANSRIQLGSHLSLLLGAACMSVLAKWA